MTEPMWIAIIAGATALLGTILGFLGSAFQAHRQIAAQRELEKLRHQWAADEDERKRKATVREQRLDQAETFGTILSQSFYQEVRSIENTLRLRDGKHTLADFLLGSQETSRPSS